MTAIDGIDKVVLNLNGYLHLWCFHILADYLDAALDTFIFISEVLEPVSSKFLESSYIFLWKGQYSLGLERNGIAHVATLP